MIKSKKSRIMKLTLSLEFGTPKESQRGVRPQKNFRPLPSQNCRPRPSPKMSHLSGLNNRILVISPRPKPVTTTVRNPNQNSDQVWTLNTLELLSIDGLKGKIEFIFACYHAVTFLKHSRTSFFDCFRILIRLAVRSSVPESKSSCVTFCIIKVFFLMSVPIRWWQANNPGTSSIKINRLA